MFYDRRPLYCKCIHLLFLICYLFIKSKVEKRKIQFLVTKRGQKAYPICFFDPQFPNFGWFHLLFLIHFHFVTTKLKKRKIPVLVTKRNKKIESYRFEKFYYLILLHHVVYYQTENLINTFEKQRIIPGI